MRKSPTCQVVIRSQNSLSIAGPVLSARANNTCRDSAISVCIMQRRGCASRCQSHIPQPFRVRAARETRTRTHPHQTEKAHKRIREPGDCAPLRSRARGRLSVACVPGAGVRTGKCPSSVNMLPMNFPVSELPSKPLTGMLLGSIHPSIAAPVTAGFSFAQPPLNFALSMCGSIRVHENRCSA